LSLRSNDPKVVFTGKYLNQFDDMRHRILSKMVDSEYPIALCLDPTKTDDEVRLALIESLSNDLARSAYKVNFIRASRGINITPDMLSNFVLLPSIQYSSGESVESIDRLSQNEDRQVVATSLPLPVPIATSEIPVVEKPPEDIEEDEEEDEDEDDYDNMTKEEYAAAMLKLMVMPDVKPS
jgi:hypothetical protein